MTNSTQSAAPETLGDDLIWGIEGIAKELNVAPRQAYHMASTKKIPVGKIGARFVASRSTLRACFGALVSGK